MASRSPVRWRSPKPRFSNRQLQLLFVALFGFLLLLAIAHAAAFVLRQANALGRQCLPEYPGSNGVIARRPRIALVSFSYEGRGAGGGRRSFNGLAKAVGANKRAYAEKMGYGYVDARDNVDPSRPPSWSKIPAVRSQLPNNDWVFWNDADTLVTNPNISLENILYAAIGHTDFNSSPDLVVTDDFNGVNAGVFFVRRTKWSENFLDTWWNQTSFVQFGSTRSGDNFALQYLLDHLSIDESQVHVRTAPMQCLFNSYPWVPTFKSMIRLISSPRTTWNGAYSDGDFLVHFAGLDDKMEWTAKILAEMRSVR